MDELLEQFLIEGPELTQRAIDDLLTLERDPTRKDTLNSAFRAIHTLKGSAGLFDLAPMGRLLQVAEDVMVALRGGDVVIDKVAIDALLASVAQCDSWLGDLAGAGRLGADAGPVATGLIDGLRRRLSAGSRTVEISPPAADATWAADLARRHADRLNGPAVAVNYIPDAGAYFAGDDPLAILRAGPGLIALEAEVRETEAPEGGAEDYDPFTCRLAFRMLYQAPLPAVQAAFRLVGDQAAVVEVAAPGAAARVDLGQTVRVDVARIDALAELVGELVVARNGLAELAARGHDAALRRTHAAIDRLTSGLHRRVTELRLTSLAPALRRLRPLARDIAGGLGKDVDLAIEGEAVEADRSIVEGLHEPLPHLLRNAIDHGVESPAGRAASGKSARAQITIRARTVGGQLLIEVGDDGRGIDPDRIREVAGARGLLSEAALRTLTDAEAVDLVFAPGFSTATQVSDISGRGVGMDAVRAAVTRLGGRVSIDSKPGRGTTVALALPRTLVMTRIMTVGCGADHFGAPLDDISETLRIARHQLFDIRHGQAFLLRGQPIPLLKLSDLLGLPDGNENHWKVLVVQRDGERVGLAVDRLLGRMDVIPRPMSGLLTGARYFTGATVAADGRALLVLDLMELVK